MIIKAASNNEQALAPCWTECQQWYHSWTSVDTSLNCQDYHTLCERIKYYLLCAVPGAGDDILEIVYIFDELWLWSKSISCRLFLTTFP